ncbi:MAG: ATP-binding protein [Candidatus Moraniibacteriota bacterium]|nr:MAG: ATP-binding protein [Candidatus Moranbacteria bacterium]
MYRRQIERIKKDLEKKMVFIVGPRQVGKTWLSKEIGKSFEHAVYLNYDRSQDRQIIQKEIWPQKTELLIFDELHKMKGWKTYLKGVFDTKPEHLKILVTGSARLNTFRKAGDSLVGRFFVHQLLPFSLSELKYAKVFFDIDRFIVRGGFPEPFLAESDQDADRWRNQYADGLIRQDILDFETVHNFRAIQMVLDLLREKVGSPVSYRSIAEDVQISPTTVKRYIEIFESLSIVFRITPYSKNIARSILKEPKIYFFDTGMVSGDDGAMFENFVALSLFKHVLGKSDETGKTFDLRYLRTKEGKEVDFAVTENGKIIEIVEAKLKDDELNTTLKYFFKKYALKSVQVVKEIKREKTIENIEIVSARNYLKDLYL